MDDAQTQPEQTKESELMQRVFGDFEARRNIVGLYDLLYKIDRRINPDFYQHNEADHG